LKRSISVPENSVETLFGSYDENLKHFESTFNVRIRTQGHEILAEGDAPGPENVERVVNQLSRRRRPTWSRRIRRSICASTSSKAP
jgi:phosphate starvation-inducible protein PhoH